MTTSSLHDSRSALAFDVVGTPKPQGSMRAFKVGNAVRTTPSGGADFAAWRNAVAEAARRAIGDQEPLDGPLLLAVTFRFPMPKSAPKRDQVAGERYKTTAPDSDKLVRTIGDALTASGAVKDDARFAVLNVTKLDVTGWTGASVRVERLS